MTGPDIIRCEPYQCDMSEVACAKQHVASQGTRLLRLWHCQPCDDGATRYARLKPAANSTVESRLKFNPQWRKHPGSRR